MSETASSQPQPAAVYTGYAQNRVPYAPTSYPYMNGQAKYNTGYGAPQLSDAVAGLNVSGQYQLGAMQAMKSNMSGSAQAGMDLNSTSRTTYGGNPLMILPNGQTLPLSAYYGQQQNSASEQSAPLQYVPTGVFPNFVGGSNLVPGGLSSYNWPYGMPAQVPGLDPNRRGSWSSNEESGPVTPVVGGQEYLSHAYYANPAGQQYIAGPIQPMKCSDNKSYEMVNLDELTQRDPPIPRAVPALWTNQDEMSLAKCLQNPEGITNIYIRGFMPDITDEMLHGWASRYGEIESCKAIIEQDTGKCKGFGFVLYFSPAAAENCIRGFFHLGFQASYAQKSRNSRLKDLEDKNSTNIYCTSVPIDWNELDLAKHFLPYTAVSTKICRDTPSGVSKEVGFARFETREVAERVIKDFHSFTNEHTGVKLFLRFADTKAQKQLKQQSQERRNWRSREYSYSVENTPSPIVERLRILNQQISPTSATSYQSPAGASNGFTPATSVSPPEILGMTKPTNTVRSSAWPTQGGLPSIINPAPFRGQIPALPVRSSVLEGIPPRAFSAVPIKPDPEMNTKTKTPSPQKQLTIKVDPASGKENLNVTVTPQSAR